METTEESAQPKKEAFTPLDQLRPEIVENAKMIDDGALPKRW